MSVRELITALALSTNPGSLRTSRPPRRRRACSTAASARERSTSWSRDVRPEDFDALVKSLVEGTEYAQRWQTLGPAPPPLRPFVPLKLTLRDEFGDGREIRRTVVESADSSARRPRSNSRSPTTLLREVGLLLIGDAVPGVGVTGPPLERSGARAASPPAKKTRLRMAGSIRPSLVTINSASILHARGSSRRA